MFEPLEEQAHPWRSFLLHCLVVVFLVPIAGLLNYWFTPLAGAVIGLVATQKLPVRSVRFTWAPAFLLFAWAATGILLSWDPSWSDVTRWQYFTNTMFGPNCDDSECLYTVVTAILTGGIGYSLVGYLTLRYRIGQST